MTASGQTNLASSPYVSFWQGGFEGADHITRQGIPLSMTESNGHLQQAAADYHALTAMNIRTVRESVGWRLCENAQGYDFSRVHARMQAASEAGVQVCWTLCHYGWPAGIDPFHPAFISRFARFCGALAGTLAPFYSHPPVYSPVNEISFTSWAMSVGFFPSSIGPGHKTGLLARQQLVRATLAACDAIWQADPRARIMHCDPLIHIAAAGDDPGLSDIVREENDAQFHAWDMLCGAREPELGGAPRYLDLIGANYYHDNQWEYGSNRRLFWHLGDAGRIPFHEMLHTLNRRYQRPVLIAETSHVGSGRGAWIQHIAAEAAQAMSRGAELLGLCLYPVIDRPDWDDPARWHHSGLWDVVSDADAPFRRKKAIPYAKALLEAQKMLDQFQSRWAHGSMSKESVMKVNTAIVFSHLRWDFVFQRPQQILTRLARDYRVIFIEEPVYEEGEAGLHLSSPYANITVARPHTNVPQPGFHDDQIARLQPLLAQLCPPETRPVVWFYTPMALPLLSDLSPSLVVYDCMDELAAFDNAPRQLLQRESALLKRADLVFTGGPSLYEARRAKHPAVHCFPSSVDVAHFEQSLDRSNEHPLQADLPHPRLGYYGVIDERIDTDLIALLADSYPQWQFIYVGPVVKIDPASLPVRDNIHYFGMQPYQALPQFLAGWDVCLMPFALNASTQFISPTKVLEYMAAERPVVSTKIRDVAQPYGDLVLIAEDGADFVRHCATALNLSERERTLLAQRMKAVVGKTSWTNTVDAISSLITTALEKTQEAGQTTAPSHSVASVNNSRLSSLLKARHLILGAGPTGLSAALHLGEDAVLLERNTEVGGWCRSVEEAGFVFDYAGHIMFSNEPYVLEMYKLLLGDNLHWQMREAWVYTEGVHTRYPFQGALYGLPPAVIRECVLGAIEARYGENEGLSAGGPVIRDCCADGSVGEQAASVTKSRNQAPENFEQFIYQTWGRGIARHFAVPYNQKLWKVPLNEMETSWLGGRVPLPDLAQIIDGALEPVSKPVGPNARFGYPLRGGFQALMRGFLPLLKGTLETGADIVQLFPQQHIAVLADGRHYQYEQLISTVPLPALIAMLGTQAPAEIQAAAAGLRHTSVRCVNLGIGRANLSGKHWIYYPGSTIFHRVFLQGNASPHCNPENGFGLICEITYTDQQPLPLEGEALNQRCIEDCISVGLFTESDPVITATQTDIPCAYVIYDHNRLRNVTLIREWLLKYDITLAGRYSEWEYYNSDHAFLAGKKAAERLTAHPASRGAVS
ncbi:NAD(P)-binding protein [Erwinia sp. P6884]|uniref:NAD(P)-binding protein n=1 Tax=Erwinia sp. P6884 TaxID=3141450 RepID=UPI00318D6BE3